MTRVVFVVQGEGRGHLTQSITLSEILRKNGYELAGILVGKSKKRDLPDFYYRKIHAPVYRFFSPNFVPSKTNGRTSLAKSFLYNIPNLYRYVKSVFFIRKKIRELDAELVVNFYEVLAGIAYAFFPPKVPFLCIGHQYLLLHPDFEFPPGESRKELKALLFFTRLTCIHAAGLLALSLRKMRDERSCGIYVVPPLLRKEVFEMKTGEGDYIHGYLRNDSYADEIIAFHRSRPEIKMHFFWDRRGVGETFKIDDTLVFHRLDDTLFLKYLSGCRAYATTAGFESVCEAMYYGKPVIMVPTHIEQACNAYDASKAGAGIVSDHFDIADLLDFIPRYRPGESFRNWEKTSESCILDIIGKILGHTQ